MKSAIKKYAVIVAAGSGQRAGGGLPKQFHDLAGLPMLWHSVRAFRSAAPDTNVILVLSEEGMEIWNGIAETLPLEDRVFNRESVRIVKGGKTRTESVSNALALIKSENRSEVAGGSASESGIDDSLQFLVAIHDAARPMISERVIQDGWSVALKSGAAVPVVPVTDSIRILDGEGGSSAVDRSVYVSVQTPQVFDGALLISAYSAMSPERVYTDDASVVEEYHPITLYDGDPTNFKVTVPHDFMVAESMFCER